MTDPNIARRQRRTSGRSATTRPADRITGRMFVELKPRDQRTRDGRRGDRAAAARSWREIPGIRVFMVNQPPINLGGGGGSSARSISSRCRTPTPTSCTSGRRCSKRKVRQMPGFEDVNSDLQLNNPQVQRGDGPRQAVDARSDRDAGRERALQRLRHAPGVADLRAEQSVSGDPARRSEVPERSRGDVAALRAVEQRPADSARVSGAAARPTSARSRSITSASCRR